MRRAWRSSSLSQFRASRKLHHKLMVIDESTIVAGSFNYTEPANDYNDENLFVIGTPYPNLPAKEGGPVDPAECAKLGSYFAAEIDRIIAESNAYQG
jgi:phosphatidylserine/phosphatidylglycerophosphate/cardiolipin synthase-like enzyme